MKHWNDYGWNMFNIMGVIFIVIFALIITLIMKNYDDRVGVVPVKQDIPLSNGVLFPGSL